MKTHFLLPPLSLSSTLLIVPIVLLTACTGQTPPAVDAQKPNLIYIITDDQGYGDVSIYNPERGKIPTPHIDRLAEEGMRFTDAHSSSSVCTPTRYNVLTGRYSWRTTLKEGVVNGYSPALLDENRLTLASLLRENGYQTAMIGKWHLGMDVPFAGEPGRGADIDWSGRLERTPTSNGFDTFWGHNASLDFPPYVYIENNHYTSQDIEHTDDRNYRYVSSRRPYEGPEAEEPVDDGKTVIRGIFREGPIAKNFDPFKTLDEFYNRSVDYIRNVDLEKPFFLYVPVTSPHTPILPTPEWLGKSPVGPYGDFIMQTDHGVGRIMQALEERGIADNTIIVFTSDNGASNQAGFDDLTARGHYASGPYRGSKSDLWEGGHRVPHIVRWPARIEAGTTTDRLTLLGDIVAAMADVVGADLPNNAAEDSRSFLPALLGQSDPATEHEAIIHHSVSGQFAIRQGDWKLLFVPGSGGWTAPRDEKAREMGLPDYQLYNLRDDPGEQNNLVNQHPEIVERLTALAREIVVKGRSTPGVPQPNDTPNDWKQLYWMNGDN